MMDACVRKSGHGNTNVDILGERHSDYFPPPGCLAPIQFITILVCTSDEFSK